MSRTVTLRLNDPVYRMFSTLAERENRPLSNFIETSAIRFIEEHHLVDEFESEEIRGNRELQRSLKRGVDDAKRRRGVFV